jgi:hypothetical protein
MSCRFTMPDAFLTWWGDVPNLRHQEGGDERLGRPGRAGA